MPLIKRLLIPLAAALAVFAMAAPSAFASTKQITIVDDNNAINANPVKTFAELKAMGVNEVKYGVQWAYYAPDGNSRTAPAGFNATDPADYPGLPNLDIVVRDANAAGIKLILMLQGPAPRWAEGTADCNSHQVSTGQCDIKTADFAAFVDALGTRYSGSYDGLPRVSAWSIWNEPNYQQLAPNARGETYFAADEYRGLVNAAWDGLHATGHGSDTFLIGELAPRGIAGNQAANGAGIKPVTFMAAVYCTTASGRRFSGALARVNGCPSSASAFRRDNPGLFDATGVADHPYAQGTAPDVPTYDCDVDRHQIFFCENPRTKKGDPLWTDLGQLKNLENVMDRSLRAYGSHRQLPIYNTEYGYWYQAPGTIPCRRGITSDCGLPPATAAYYDNWAEYISYRNPRLVSFDQYQLIQPRVGSWTDGLISYTGKPTLAFSAFEVPLYMPTTSVRHASNLTVWGDGRAFTNNHSLNKLLIQFKGRRGGWKTVKTVTLTNSEGYFQTSVRFTQSGTVRLAYDGLTSRTQSISVK